MRKTVLLVLVLAALTSASAFASGSSIPSAGLPSGAEQDPLLVTETVRCRVVEVRDDGTVVIRDEGKDELHALAYTKKTKFHAQDKKAFGGRKKIRAADLEVGHELKVTVRPATGEVVKVKVLKAT